MLDEDPFYFAILRKSVSLFGTLFKNIYITRTNAQGIVIDDILVPIIYANKDKMLTRVDADPALTKQTAIDLPIMSFEILGMNYDGSRKLATMNKTAGLDLTNKNNLKLQYGPVPYDIKFALYVYVKNAEDAAKIIEQIIPYFTPDWTPSVHLVPELGHIVDIPIILDAPAVEDSYTGSFDNRRALIWTLNFTMKTYFYGPVKSKPIIKFANTNFLVGNTSDNSGVLVNVNTRPGLDANGYPTTNSSISIGANNIIATDNFGFIENVITVRPK